MALNKTQLIFWYIDQYEFTTNPKLYDGLIDSSYLFGSEFQVFNYIYDIVQSYNPDEKPRVVISSTSIEISNKKYTGKGMWTTKHEVYINAFAKPQLKGKRHYIDLTVLK